MHLDGIAGRREDRAHVHQVVEVVGADLVVAAELLAGEALSDPGDATVMRTSSAGTVTLTDGPYAEVIEGMGGFYLLEAPDLDVVVDLLKVLPRYDIQIHPTIDVTL